MTCGVLLFWCAVTRKYTSRASATIARSFSLPYRSYAIFVGLRFVSYTMQRVKVVCVIK